MTLTDLEKQLETALQQHGDGTDGSHDIHHARRVLLNARQIAATEPDTPDLRHLTAAAYLHDLINVPKNSPQRSQASQLSAEAAAPILRDLTFSEKEITAIQHTITAHSFSANIQPETIEAKILQDADRMESLGALGIARTFYTAGRMNSSLFHGDDPFAQTRNLDDATYSIDHFKAKLLTLAQTMQTESGKSLAQERTAPMHQFLDQLATEIGTTNPW